MADIIDEVADEFNQLLPKTTLELDPNFSKLPSGARVESLSPVTGKRVKGYVDQDMGQVVTGHTPLWKAPTTPQAELRKETEQMLGPSRFLAGVGGGMYGLGLGAAQAGAELLNKANIVSPETVANLRQQGAEHKQTMTDLKMGQGGFTNPASWGEFVGETAPTMLAGGGLGAKAASKIPFIANMGSNTLRGALTGGAAGTAGGAALGFTQPLAPGQSRTLSTIEGAILGGVGGSVLGGLGGVGQSAFEAVKGRVGPVADRINFYLEKIAPYSPSQVKKMNVEQRADFMNTRATGVENLYKLRDEIALPDETGAMVTGRLPKTQFEFLQAIHQGKNKLFDMYDSITQHAQGGGLQVPVDDILAALRRKQNDKAYTPQQREYIKKQIQEWSNEGPLSPREAQGRITGMNQTLGDFYSGKPVKYEGDVRVDKEILDTFRQTLNKTMEQAGPEYAGLRKAWGSIQSLESDAMRKLEAEARKRSKDNPLDLLAGEQVLYAVAKGNPAYLIPAAGTYAMKHIRQYLTNPDRHVKRMFDETGKALKDQRISKPTLTDFPAPEPPVMVPRTPIGNYGPTPESQVRLRTPEGNYGPTPESQVRLRTPEGNYGPTPESQVRLRIPEGNYGPTPESQVRLRTPEGNYGPTPESQVRARTPLTTAAPNKGVPTSLAAAAPAAFSFESAVQELTDRGMSPVEARDQVLRLVKQEMLRRRNK